MDLGERGVGHPLDLALLGHADLANVACGGHAGSADEAAFWSREAAVRGVAVTAHLSYPDRSGFGRRAMAIPFDRLARSLAWQLARLPETAAVKLHGALYQAADTDAGLAPRLAAWLAGAGVARVLTPASGALAAAAADAGLAVVPEAFADRCYTRESATGRPVLLSRRHAGAVLAADRAAEQARGLAVRGVVTLREGGEAAVAAETLCVHGDGPEALAVASAVAGVLRESSA
ncbi:LamB/YcsF family protein [Phycisphaera mikurensis]|uniref:LamB/YcsF family protein n=1 Tax=Phycisphaera mikurensis TaxID=547188 RepID=UPI0028F3F910|nr:LamB/YcsF family protein [Phycisphaera mikurensis]